MKKEVIENCPVCLKTCFISMPYIDNKSNIWYNRNGGYHSGIDLQCKEVYSICPSVCTYVGYDNQDKHVVIIQYDAHTSFRYANLAEVLVNPGDIIEIEQQIGITYGNVLHFELLTRELSSWCVRVGHETYYKHDPYKYVKGEVEFDLRSEYNIEYDVDPDLQTLF